MSSDFRALASHLQKATRGTPKLSEAVAQWAKAEPVIVECLCCDRESREIPPFTESIDAAMTLVPVHQGLRLERDAQRSGKRGDIGWTAHLPGGVYPQIVRAATAPLAVCAASILALGEFGRFWDEDCKQSILAPDQRHITDQDEGAKILMASGIMAEWGGCVRLAKDGYTIEFSGHDHLASIANLCADELRYALMRRASRAA